MRILSIRCRSAVNPLCNVIPTHLCCRVNFPVCTVLVHYHGAGRHGLLQHFVPFDATAPPDAVPCTPAPLHTLRAVQVQPPGFMLHMLPYTDEVRFVAGTCPALPPAVVPKVRPARAGAAAVAAAGALVDALTDPRASRYQFDGPKERYREATLRGQVLGEDPPERSDPAFNTVRQYMASQGIPTSAKEGFLGQVGTLELLAWFWPPCDARMGGFVLLCRFCSPISLGRLAPDACYRVGGWGHDIFVDTRCCSTLSRYSSYCCLRGTRACECAVNGPPVHSPCISYITLA